MTTQRQREANRRNAARSTGPRTAAGKARARYNAYKHGLATRIAGDAAMAAEVARLAAVLSGESAGLGPVQHDTARIAAEANLELGRVRAFKAKLRPTKAETEPSPVVGDRARARRLRGPAAIDAATQAAPDQARVVERYERRAFSRRNRALRTLSATSNDP